MGYLSLGKTFKPGRVLKIICDGGMAKTLAQPNEIGKVKEVAGRRIVLPLRARFKRGLT
jgi:hypothetical protein